MMHRLISRYGGVLAAFLAIAAVAAQFGWVSADPATGPSPATSHTVTFSASPVDGLTDGAAITFEVTTSGGTTLVGKLTAHICEDGFDDWDTSNFGYSGKTANRCVYNTGNPVTPPGITSGGLTSGSYEVSQTYGGSESDSGPLTFHAGTGSVSWVNATGTSGSLLCDSDDPCDMVVEVNLAGDATPTTFFVQPLNYATGTTTTTTSSTTTTTGGGTTTTTTGGGTTTTTTTTTTIPGATTTTHAPTTTTTTLPPTTTTHAPTTTTTTPTTTTLAAGTTTTTTPSGDGTVTPSTVGPDGTVSITSTGWMPGSQVDVTLHSDPVTLGALTADQSGTVQGQFTIPSGTSDGAHTVELSGNDAQNAPRTVSLAVTVSTTTVTTVAVGTGGAGGTGSSISSGSGSTLAFTGSPTRALVSIALLLIALGLFALGQHYRRREVPTS